jgi:uncharacterized protein (TIGR02996 family)
MISEVGTALRVVLAHPADDKPRLLYADALAQSPRPADQARAEFIRIQLELAVLPPNDPCWPRLIGQERELLEQHRAAWERPLRESFRPSLSSPGRWLRSHLFGGGGRWGFQRGFVEHILASAPSFLSEDLRILTVTPIRRIVLTHASEYVGVLASEPRLNRLESLHLVGDMETDEDLDLLAANAKDAGLTVLEFRLPRFQRETEDLFEALRAAEGDDPVNGITIPAWDRATLPAKDRLRQLANLQRYSLLAEDAAFEGELFALNEWVYLGESLKEAGAWAIAKSHHDLEDDEGRCRRLILLRNEAALLRESPYFIGEIG